MMHTADDVDASVAPVAHAKRFVFRPTYLEWIAIVLLVLLGVTYASPHVVQWQRDHIWRDKRRMANEDLAALNASLAMYKVDSNDYPTTAQGLEALRTRPTSPTPWNWRGPYVTHVLPRDPWGNAYAYRAGADVVGARYELVSLGGDGKVGGTEDAEDIVIRR